MKVRTNPKMKIVNRDDLLVLHQAHEKQSPRADRYREKLLKNKKRYENKWKRAIAI